MYRINYCEKEKDTTYDEAYFTTMNNNNQKWSNYYAYLQEKYDLCYNIESITIDVSDIKCMKYDCYSNGILHKLYLICKNKHALEKYEQITITNDSIFAEELIYNILKTDWLINEELVDTYDDELKRRIIYFKAMIESSDDSKDIKVQFRNKLFAHFIKEYNRLKDNKEHNYEEKKVLILEHKHKPVNN